MRYIHIYIFIFINILLSENQDVIKEMDSKITTYEYKNAANIGENWLKNNPEDVEVMWRLAQCNFYIGQQSEDIKIHKEHYYPGLNYATKALDIDPKSARANHWYAVLIGQTGEIEGTEQKIINSYDTKKYAEIAIASNNDEIRHYVWLGNSYYALGDYNNARTAWEDAFKIEPQSNLEKILIKEAKNNLAKLR